MDAEVLFCTAILVFSFVGVFCLVEGLSAAIRRARARVSFAQTSGSVCGAGSAYGIFRHLLLNGVPALRGVSQALMRISVVDAFLDNMTELFCDRGWYTKKSSIASLLFASLIVFGVLASILARNVVAGVAVDALVIVVIALMSQNYQDEQNDALCEGVPNSLLVMSECFQSGYSLVQTMQMVAEQSSAKLSQVFGKCANMLELGASSKEALGALQTEISVSELSFVAVALDVQHQTGGSISYVLGSAEQMVQDKIDLRRSLQVQTAQARLSARVVCVMPFILVFVLSMISEGFMTPFFSGPAGFVMLGVALAMEASGVFMVRRMLKMAL